MPRDVSSLLKEIEERLPMFLIAIRFKFMDNLWAAQDEKIHIANDSITVWELFDLMMGDAKCNSRILQVDSFIELIQSMKSLYMSKNGMWNFYEIFGYLDKITSVKNGILPGPSTPFSFIQEMMEEYMLEVVLQAIDSDTIPPFLDPAVGIAKLLWWIKMWCRKEGYTEKEILPSLWGIDISRECAYIAGAVIDPHGLLEKPNIFWADSLEFEVEESMKKKFNIFTNLPFQRSNTKAHKLWIPFLKRCMDEWKGEDKIAGIITPALLWSGRHDRIKELREHVLPEVRKVKFTADKHFDVGEKMCSTIFREPNSDPIIVTLPTYKEVAILKKDLKEAPLAATKEDALSQSIIDKIEMYPDKLALVSDFNVNDGAAAPKALLEHRIISEKKTSKYCYEFVHSGAQIYYTYSQFEYGGKPKVFLNFSSSYEKMFYGTGVVGKQVEGILVSSKEEADCIINTLTKKVFRFYIDREKSGGFNTGIYNLPALDFSKEWTDQEIYEYFNLTKEEIELIEEAIK